MATFTVPLPSSGTELADLVQQTIEQCTHGDTVIIPPGNWTFNKTVDNKVPHIGGTFKNIKILGAGPNFAGMIGPNVVRISQGGTITNRSLFAYTCNSPASPTTTCEIGNMELYGEDSEDHVAKLNISGIANINESGGIYTGGCRVHHIRFSVDNSLPESVDVGGWHCIFTGWIMGVFDHCEIYENITRDGSENSGINHNGSPTGQGTEGDFACGFPTDGSDVTATKDMMYFEDNIYHHIGLSFDTNGNSGGGALYCQRHNICWGSLGGHGTRESGGEGQGTRHIETYNNIFARLTDLTLNPIISGSVQTIGKQNFNSQEQRAGSMLCYNNFISIVDQNPSHVPANTKIIAGPSVYCSGANGGIDKFYLGPDASNPLDLNEQRSSFITDGRGISPEQLGYSSAAPQHTHTIDTGYSFTGPEETVVNGVVTVSNPVTAGTSDPTLCGSIYGHSTGVQPVQATSVRPTDGKLIGNPNITNLSIQGWANVSNGGNCLANKFRGFVIRDASVKRDTNMPRSNFLLINTHPAVTDGSGTITSITVIGANDGLAAMSSILSLSTHYEIRRVRQYWNVCGSNQMLHQALVGSNPLTLTSPAAPASWTGMTETEKVWGNMRCISSSINATQDPATLPWVATDLPTQILSKTPGACLGSYHQTQRATLAQIIAPTFNDTHSPNSGWDPTESHQNKSNPRCRVGPDWQDTSFSWDNTIGNTGVWSSFYVDGAGGFQYPHPLVSGTVTPTAPSIAATTPTPWVVGVSGHSFTITCSGSSPIAFTVSVGTLPAGLSLNGSTGVISGTATATGVTNFTIRADNAQGFDTQAFTITVNAQSDPPPTCNITQPTNNQIFLTTDTVTINVTAADTSPGFISQVVIKDGSTVLTTKTATPYTYSGTFSVAGSHVLTAIATDNTGNSTTSATASIIVTSVNPPPSAPVIVLTT